jgi:hypothetical protein
LVIAVILASFFTWPGWSFFVAVGTLSLAGVTAWLASESRRQIKLATREVEAVEKQTDEIRGQAEATQHQAEVSAASLEATVRPVLVGAIAPADLTSVRELASSPSRDLEPVTFPGNYVVPVRPLAVHYEERDDMLYLSFCVRNIGAGVAFVQRVALLTRTAHPVRISPPIIAPNETARLLIALTLKQSNGQFTDVNQVTKTGRGFVQAVVGLFYTGASSDIALTTELTLSDLPDEQGWLFTGTKVWDGDTRADLGTREERPLLASTDNIG